MFQVPRGRVLKTKDFFLQKFVNLQKQPILTVGHSNSYKRLKTKEKTPIFRRLCLVVGLTPSKSGKRYHPKNIQKIITKNQKNYKPICQKFQPLNMQYKNYFITLLELYHELSWSVFWLTLEIKLSTVTSLKSMLSSSILIQSLLR